MTSKQLYGEFQPGITENGRTIANGEPIEGYYPALITKEEFDSLQAFRSPNYIGGGRAKKGSTVPNVLSGMLKCGYCNGPMTISGAAAKRIKTADGDVMRAPRKYWCVMPQGVVWAAMRCNGALMTSKHRS